jgi:formate-dependent nitrite reductase cytochrome c552 subunit
MLKAQHPEFDLWSQGIHAKSVLPVQTVTCLIPV